ncbi:MAG: LacI family DNA-binding transcriptional regulator [Candidatus Marinimicrobia bacterium]|nr:LacI family DNA-binding transcriptional regulator [Candidatus Neomarinimicrobiota bacterium]
MSKIKPVTLQDIATRLGISKVSVSKALRRQSDIGQATTEKVLALAKELGYRPNIIAQKLTAKHTRTIGLVVPKIAHHFLTQAIDAIYLLANEKDYEIIMMVSEEDDTLEQKHLKTLLSMRVDGLLISVTEQTRQTDIFQRVAENGTPLVFFDRVIEDLGFSCITSADEQGTLDLVDCAIDKGYRELGHIGGYQNVSIGRLRYKGFLKALENHGLTAADSHVIFGGFSRSDGYSGLQKIHEKGALPQIIFAVTYPVALGVLSYAKEHGIQIPQDLDIVCFGSSNYNSFISPAITGIKQPAQEIGRIALEQVLRQIHDPSTDDRASISVPVKINQAETCIGIKD